VIWYWIGIELVLVIGGIIILQVIVSIEEFLTSDKVIASQSWTGGFFVFGLVICNRLILQDKKVRLTSQSSIGCKSCKSLILQGKMVVPWHGFGPPYRVRACKGGDKAGVAIGTGERNGQGEAVSDGV
jgi:hypothetical protein